MNNLSTLLREAREGTLDRAGALRLLKEVRDYSDLMRLMRVASEVRDECVGRIYKFEAFMSPITRCTTNPPCRYCRRSAGVEHEPLMPEEIRWGAERVAATRIRRLEIGGGTPWDGAGEAVINAVRIIKEVAPNLLIRVNVGPALSRDDLLKLKELGVVEVSANFETMNREVFRKVKPGDDLNARIALAKAIDSVGLKLSTTIMVGIGSTYEDYVNHIFWLKENIRNLGRVAITVLRPIKGTPMESAPAGSVMDALKVGALARVVLRHVDLGFGGIMNDHRLLPLRIMAGGNREVHLSVLVTKSRTWLRQTISPAETEVVTNGDLIFINYLPLITRIVREAGMEPESPPPTA